MATVVGSAWGQDVPVGAITVDTIGRNNYVTLSTEAWLHIFNKAAIMEGQITNDTLGLYSRLLVDGKGKAKFGTIKTPHHLFRPRQNGCVWSPNGKIRIGLTEFDTCPIQAQNEQCPDAFWNSCYEGLFNTGRGVRDLLSGQIAQIVNLTFSQYALGLGNSFFELFNFAKHPDIIAADTNGTYNVEDDRWDNYYAQMVGTDERPVNCAGIVTILDSLADDGEQYYNIEIPAADFDASNNYTGDINELFNTMVDNASPELQIMAEKGIRSGAGLRYPIMLVSRSFYKAYRDYLITTFPQIPAILNYQLFGADNSVSNVPGVLNWNGIPVVSWDALNSFDRIVGTTSHKICLVAPGTFGLASDVESLAQYEGMGMVTVQKLDPPDNGKIYMDTTLRWGAALADREFAVYARKAA